MIHRLFYEKRYESVLKFSLERFANGFATNFITYLRNVLFKYRATCCGFCGRLFGVLLILKDNEICHEMFFEVLRVGGQFVG